MQQFTYSDRGIALTKEFEGLRLEAYQDVAGVWTIGYGHTGPDVLAGVKISAATAEDLLRKDLGWAVAAVNDYVHADITQSEFDAMVDFTFNVGRNAFLTSTLLRQVNLGHYAAAAEQFLLWDHAGGKVVAGLDKRRRAERELFLEVG